MNLSELLSLVYLYENEFIKALKRKKNKFSVFQQFEIDFTFNLFHSFIIENDIENRIEKEPNAVLSDEEEQTLVEMLNDRWQRIMSTNSSYTEDTQNPANQLFVGLAQSLSTAVKIPVMQLLMPTLVDVTHPITLIDIRTDRSIKQFVMSDDNHHLIHVESALQQYKSTGKMQKTNDQGVLVDLSESEIYRVAHHTEMTEKYFNILKIKQTLKERPNTLGFRLQQLSLGLKAASIDGEGEEFHAGSQADNAIIEFSAVLNNLPNTIRSELMSSFFEENNKIISFDYIWDAITNPRTRKSNASLCAKDLSYYIDSLLDAHLRFFNVEVRTRAIFEIDKHFSDQERYISKITAMYEGEIYSDDFVTYYEYAPESEFKFLTLILSSDKGIEFFVNKKSNFTLLKKLDEESKNACLSLLVKSEPGKMFLLKNKYPIETIRHPMPSSNNNVLEEPLQDENSEVSIDSSDFFDGSDLSSSSESEEGSLAMDVEDQVIVNPEYDEEMELKKAIEASLKDSKFDVIDISSDDEKGVNRRPEKIEDFVDEKAEKDEPRFKEEKEPNHILTERVQVFPPLKALKLPKKTILLDEVPEKKNNVNSKPVALPQRKIASIDDVLQMMNQEHINIQNEIMNRKRHEEKKIEKQNDGLKRKRDDEKVEIERDAKRSRSVDVIASSNKITTVSEGFTMRSAVSVSSNSLFSSSSQSISTFVSTSTVEAPLPKAPPKRKPSIPVGLFVDLCAKAQKCIDNEAYLESLHYIKRAYDFLCKTEGLSEQWCHSQQSRLRNLANPIVDLFLREGIEERMAGYIRDPGRALFATDWCRDAELIIRQLFRNAINEDKFVRFFYALLALRTATESVGQSPGLKK